MRSAIALLRKEEADRRRDEKARLKKEKEEKSLREMMAANEAQKRHKVELRALAMEEEQRLVKIRLDKFEKDTQKEKMEQLDLEMQDRDWEGLSSGEETNMNILDLDNKEVRIVNDNSPELTTFKKLTKLSKGPKRTNLNLLEI